MLGATQIDTNFNVNVHTDSSGFITGGSGGHSDTAEESKLSIIVAPLFRARLPIIVDKAITVSTPGKNVDVLVTQRGIAVNPLRQDIYENIKKSGLPIFDIHDLKALAEKYTGVPDDYRPNGRCIAKVEHRDGQIIDEIKQAE